MLEFIDKILMVFRPCFSREAAFGWFVTIVLGIMARSDSLGATSIIRDLALDPALYASMAHFFRADSWDLGDVASAWAGAVAAKAPLMRIAGRAVLIGDGVKRAADGRYMPCVKKMVQESEDSSKPRFIHGHLFGAVGVLVGSATKSFCLPLSLQVHDGDAEVSRWLGDSQVSHVVQMARDGFWAAGHIGRSLFVLDRYFLTEPMLREWAALSEGAAGALHVVTRAKRNCVAYGYPGEYKGRGRRPIRGAAVRLSSLFTDAGMPFQEAEMTLYGSKKKVRYLKAEYLWGQGLYQPLLFVLAEYDGMQAILACTDLSMQAEDVIRAYACRFKIEAMFRELKQQFGGLGYRFWTKAVPKLDRYRRKGSPDPLCQVVSESGRDRVIRTLRAIEGYVMLSSIAMGITQMLCLEYEGKIRVSDYRYLRTPSRPVMSEASMMCYLRRNLFRFMARKGSLTITKIITSKQIPPEIEDLDLFIS